MDAVNPNGQFCLCNSPIRDCWRKYVSSPAKCRFDAREVPFRRPRSAVSSPAKVRFVYPVVFHFSLITYHFSLFIFHFSLFTFHFSLFIFHLSLFIFHFSFFTFHFSLFTFHFSLFTLKSSSHRTIGASIPDAQRAEAWEDESLHPPIILPFSGKRIRSDALQAFLKVSVSALTPCRL